MGYHFLTKLKFPVKEEKPYPCTIWYEIEQEKFRISLLIPTATFLTNNIVEIIIVSMSGAQKPYDESQILVDAIKGIAGIQIVNLGILLFMLSINTSLDYYLHKTNNGQYDHFSVEWYKTNGVLIF